MAVKPVIYYGGLDMRSPEEKLQDEIEEMAEYLDEQGALSAMNKQYLGDSVYADFDGFGITLTTENGFGPSNTIYLEPQVLAALETYIRRICARRSRRRQNPE